MAHNARWCHSCGWSAHNQCGYIVSLQWRPRLVLCPPGGLLQLWPVVYATMCTSHFIVIFVLHCIQWFCTIALYFHLVFSLFVVCWYPYIFIDVLPCTLMFLCEIRAIKISYSYSLWPWPLTYDLEKLIRSGHYHYQCAYQIWEQSIPWFLSYPVNTIAGGFDVKP